MSLKYRISILFVSVALFIAYLFLFSPDLRKLNDLSKVIKGDKGEVLRVYLNSKDKYRIPANFENLNKTYLEMLIEYEDKRFYKHIGFDPFAISRATFQYIKNREIHSGASTITMQLVRMLEPKDRNIFSKMSEVIKAVQLELKFSKKEILEMYLTLTPYGANIEGIEAASQFYFNKNSKELNKLEAALLVGLPQSPTYLRPDRYPERALKQRNKIINRVSENKKFQFSEWEKTTKIFTAKRDYNLYIPHLTDKLALNNKQSLFETYIDMSLQKLNKRTLLSHADNFSKKTNLSAIVIENKTGKVISYIGSLDYFSQEKLGANNMVAAIRSPGSTLKPFIYAAAMDKNIIHSSTEINDDTYRSKNFTPLNFDKTFSGKVKVYEALQRSLNIPTVKVLEKIGVNNFLGILNKNKVNYVLPKKHHNPGLAIALGGIGISLEELGALYVALANEGQYKKLRYFKNDLEENKEQFLFSKKTSKEITNILRKANSNSVNMQSDFLTNSYGIAHKTGTSYGYRDAFAFGYTPSHTIGVWVGRTDGTANAVRSGVQDATPVMFSLFENVKSLRTNKFETWTGYPAINMETPKAIKELKETREVKITFPKPNSIFILEKNNSLLLPLEAIKGQKPYLWIVNNKIISENNGLQSSKDMLWQPASLGVNTLNVIDANGHSDTIKVVIKKLKK